MADQLDFRDPEWVAEQLSIDKNAVYRYLSEGTLPGLQLGRKWLISESSLVEFLKAEERRQTHGRRLVGGQAAGEAGADYERLAEAAREVLRVAREEAVRLQHNWIGQEHILLAIAAHPGCSAMAVLGELGVSSERLMVALHKRKLLNQGPSPVAGEIGLTPRAQQALKLGFAEATELNHASVGPEHLLLGMLREGQGAGAAVLTSLGVALDATRKAVGAAADPPA